MVLEDLGQEKVLSGLGAEIIEHLCGLCPRERREVVRMSHDRGGGYEQGRKKRENESLFYHETLLPKDDVFFQEKERLVWLI
jgi:hypothetical protein